MLEAKYGYEWQFDPKTCRPKFEFARRMADGLVAEANRQINAVRQLRMQLPNSAIYIKWHVSSENGARCIESYLRDKIGNVIFNTFIEVIHTPAPPECNN